MTFWKTILQVRATCANGGLRSRKDSVEALPALAGMVFCEMVCGKEDAEMKDLKLCHGAAGLSMEA